MRERQRRVDFTNSWMFGRVMTDESICRDVIRAVLGIEAVRVEYLNAEQVLDLPRRATASAWTCTLERAARRSGSTTWRCRRSGSLSSGSASGTTRLSWM